MGAEVKPAQRPMREDRIQRKVCTRINDQEPLGDTRRGGFSSPALGPTVRPPPTQETPMNRSPLCVLASLLALSSAAFGAEGLIEIKSPHAARDTMNRFEEVAKQRGLNVFARIDHAAGAAKVGKTLRPTEVLIFGNPQGGTPLMECAQSAGIDLPLKALVWEDAQGQVWLGYNDPAFLAQRHGAAQCPAVGGLSKALAGLAEAAVAR
jgi:uncharacterized protein (DUF302 family)